MKRKFYAYLLWPVGKKLIFAIVSATLQYLLKFLFQLAFKSGLQWRKYGNWKCQCDSKKTLNPLWYAWCGSVQWWCFMSKFTTTCSQQCKLEQSHGMAFLKCYCEIHRTGRVVYFLDIMPDPCWGYFAVIWYQIC